MFFAPWTHFSKGGLQKGISYKKKKKRKKNAYGILVFKNSLIDTACTKKVLKMIKTRAVVCAEGEKRCQKANLSLLKCFNALLKKSRRCLVAVLEEKTSTNIN